MTRQGYIMEVWEKINYLIEEKKLTKKDFIKKLLQLEPRLKSTGEIPSSSTINGYLYGQREIKIELIPYVAEALEIKEQELFNFDIEYASDYNIRYSKEAREILDLLQYAPKNMIEHIKNRLRDFKTLYVNSIKDI